MAILKSTAAKLEAAQAKHDQAMALLAELQSKLEALDPAADDYAAAAAALDAHMAVSEKTVGLLGKQMIALEIKLTAERFAEKERQRIAAIGAVEKLLPARVQAAERLEQAIKAVGTALAELDASRQKITKDWPADHLEYPFAFYFDMGRAMRVLSAAFTSDARSPNNLTDVIERLTEAVDGFAAGERRQLVELLESLRETKPDEPQEQAA